MRTQEQPPPATSTFPLVIYYRVFPRLFAGMGMLGVACGSFGAHVLRERFSPEQMHTWETATLYLFIHSLAGLLAVRHTWKPYAAIFFLAGCVFFPLPLYFLALSGERWLGAVAPFGGVSFLFGWFFLARFFERRVPGP